jgi:hypothetical protein
VKGHHLILVMRVHLPALDDGVLAEVEALGLDLLEVRQLTSEGESSDSGDSCSP